MEERERHRLAFERYVAAGAGRSLVRIAEELRVSESAVKGWSRAFRWRERLEARSREIAASLSRDSADVEAAQRRGDRRLVEMALVQIAKAVLDGRTKPSIADMDRMIRLRRELEDRGRAHEDRVFVVRRDGYARDDPDDVLGDGGEAAGEQEAGR